MPARIRREPPARAVFERQLVDDDVLTLVDVVVDRARRRVRRCEAGILAVEREQCGLGARPDIERVESGLRDAIARIKQRARIR